MKAKKDKKRTGPEPDRVKLPGDWEDAIAKALKKERPKAGWPTDASRKKRKN
jgi:hypothetical protein